MNKNDKLGDSMPTAEFPAVTNRRRQLLQLEIDNQNIINLFRRELTNITVDLAELAEELADKSLKTNVLKRLLPTAQAVRGVATSDSMLVEIVRLNQIAETIIQSQVPAELSQRVEVVREKIRSVLSSINETKPGVDKISHSV